MARANFGTPGVSDVRAGCADLRRPMTELLVNIDVNDLPAAEDFYCRALGLTVSRRFGSDGVELVGASSRIYLLNQPAGTRASTSSPDTRKYDRHWTPVHLDIVVDDLEEAIERSIEAGGTREQPVRKRPWGRIAVVSDPFGHGYCLIQFSPEGYDAIADPR